MQAAVQAPAARARPPLTLARAAAGRPSTRRRAAAAPRRRPAAPQRCSPSTRMWRRRLTRSRNNVRLRSRALRPSPTADLLTSLLPLLPTLCRTAGGEVDGASRRRYDTYRELYLTEVGYARDLQVVLRVFVLPLRNARAEGRVVLPDDDINALFSNVEALLGVSIEMLTRMRAGLATDAPLSTVVAESFVVVSPFLRLYHEYCANHAVAAATMERLTRENNAFVAFCRYSRTRPESRGLDLASYLIKPVQRVTKYALLFDAIVRKMSEDHPQYAVMSKALTESRAAAEGVNEWLRTRDLSARAAALALDLASWTAEEPGDTGAAGDAAAATEDVLEVGRRLLLEEPDVLVSVGSTTRSCTVFIFTDLLLACTPRRGGLLGVGGTRLSLFQRVPLGDATVVAPTAAAAADAQLAGRSLFSVSVMLPGTARAGFVVSLVCVDDGVLSRVKGTLAGAIVKHKAAIASLAAAQAALPRR